MADFGKVTSRRTTVSASRRTVLLGAGSAAIAMALDSLGNRASSQTLKSYKLSEAAHLGMYVSVYAAKHGGKNGYAVCDLASPTLAPDAQSHHDMARHRA